MTPAKLLFGTAGIPLATPSPVSTVAGIGYVKQILLDGMELEFVHSVNISQEKAVEVAAQVKKLDVVLTCHGQYYINLFSLDKAKRQASVQRVINAATRAHECGAWSMTFHPAFYQSQDKKAVYEGVKSELASIIQTLKDSSIPIWVRPETTGKPTQFGTLQELLKLSTELEQVMPCIDFSHLHARTNGKYNTTEEFKAVLEMVESHLGRDGLNNMHIHLSGIKYGEKGELNHLILEQSDMQWKDLLKVWREFKIKGMVICESPNIEQDAIMLKEYYISLS